MVFAIRYYLLFIHRFARETPEVMNTSVRVISRPYEFALEYHFVHWFPSRSTNNAECLVHSAYWLLNLEIRISFC